MKLVCIKSGKCIKEGSGFIEVFEGDEGNIIEKQRAGDVVAFINGTRVLIPVDHLNHVEKSFLASFKVLKEELVESKLLNRKIKIMTEKLETLTGKKIVLE